MDFSNRSNSSSDNSSQSMNQMPGNINQPMANRKTKPAMGNKSSLTRVAGVIFGGAVVVLVLALLAFLAFTGNNSSNESSYINTTKLQAVFLNTGQVYFGNLKTINSNYFVLNNIYYLQTSSGSNTSTATTSSSSVSLVKLGCELHAPYDQMVINSSQVTFWENLQSTGQVAKAVAAFEKANPNGQKCSNTSTAATTNTNSVQPSTATTVK